MNTFLMRMLMPVVLQMIEKVLSPENIMFYGDKLFDLIEDAVKDSKTDIDDITVLPIIKIARKAFGIPDND